jgi:hypothetical protein
MPTNPTLPAALSFVALPGAERTLSAVVVTASGFAPGQILVLNFC